MDTGSGLPPMQNQGIRIDLGLSDSDIQRVSERILAEIKPLLQKGQVSTDSIMDKRKLAEYLKVSVSTINDWVSDGVIPYMKLSPGQSGAVRFSRRAIDKWLQERAVPVTS